MGRFQSRLSWSGTVESTRLYLDLDESLSIFQSRNEPEIEVSQADRETGRILTLSGIHDPTIHSAAPV